MNLIGHLVCAAPQEPACRLGAVLPDLMGIFRRRPRVEAIAGLWRGDGAAPPEVAALLQGIAFHHHVDVHFHRAPLFKERARELRVAISGASDEPGLKRFFAAHLLLELYYDGLLLEGEPACGDGFYALLEATREGLLPRFMLRHPELEGGPLGVFLERIVSERFVEDYRSLEGIFYRVERILLRYRQRALNEMERQAAALYLTAHEEALRSGLLLFVETMQRWEGAEENTEESAGEGPGEESAGAPRGAMRRQAAASGVIKTGAGEAPPPAVAESD